MLDDQGEPTDDPKFATPGGGGTIQLLGGMDVGHKGYGLTLLVEALTGGLAGFGRADPKQGWGATVFVQLLDPEAFGGLAEEARQMDFIADACRRSAPRADFLRSGIDKVRLPGERAMTRTPIACGESEFTRFDFRDLIAARACDVLQPDMAIFSE